MGFGCPSYRGSQELGKGVEVLFANVLRDHQQVHLLPLIAAPDYILNQRTHHTENTRPKTKIDPFLAGAGPIPTLKPE